MPDTFLNELELDNLIKEKNDRDLLEFTARSAYKSSVVLVDHTKRIKKLESRSKKEIGASGGIGAGIGTAVGALVQFFLGRG